LQIRNIDLTQIKTVLARGRIFEEEGDLSLVDSPERLFTHPVFLQKTDNGYTILYGFESVAQLRSSKAVFCPAFILPARWSLSKCVTLVATCILRSRALWPVEIAKLLDLFTRNGLSKSKIAELFRQVTHIKLNVAVAKQYLAILEIESSLQQYLITKKAPLKTWRLAAELPSEIRRLMLDLIVECQPTLSLFEEIARNVSEILHREESAVDLERLNLVNVLKNTDYQPAEKLAIIRGAVQELRYPNLTQHTQRLSNLLKEIKVPQSVRIDYDKNFEEQKFRIEAEISSADDLKAFGDFLTGTEKAKLERLLKIL